MPSTKKLPAKKSVAPKPEPAEITAARKCLSALKVKRDKLEARRKANQREQDDLCSEIDGLEEQMERLEEGESKLDEAIDEIDTDVDHFEAVLEDFDLPHCPECGHVLGRPAFPQNGRGKALRRRGRR